MKNTPKPEQPHINKGSMILQALFIWRQTWVRDWWILPLLTRVYLLSAYTMDVWELLRRWRVERGSKGLERKWSIFWLYACVSCLSVWSQDQMEFYVKVAGSLPLFPSSFLSFFFSLFILFIFLFSLFLFYFFLYLSLPFFCHHSFFKQAKADTFLKQGYSFGWLELVAWRCAISPTLGLLCESQVCNRGLLLSVF